MKKRGERYEAIPESLAFLLQSIRERIFGSTKSNFANHLNAVRREPNLATQYRGDVVDKIERRIKILDFEHIETYSRVLGLPTCALSFVSRYQRMPIEEAELLATAMLEIVQEARKSGGNRLTAYDLHVLATKFQIEVSRKPDLPPLTYNRPSTIDAFAEQARKKNVPEVDASNLPLFKKDED